MKKGLNFHLRVNFEDFNIDDAEKIEFIFKASEDNECPTLKSAVYPLDVKKEKDSNELLIPFSSVETYTLPKYIFMDTRITLKGISDQPETNIVKLRISETLFEKDGEQNDHSQS